MTRIVLDNEDLDLGDSLIRWECTNTITDDSVFQSDYSFPTVLPFSNKNKRKLEYAHRTDALTQTKVWDIMLYYADKCVKAQLKSNGTTAKGYSVSIAAGIHGLVNSDKNLKELKFTDPEGNPSPKVVDGVIDYAILGLSFEAYYNRNANWKSVMAFPSYYNPDFYGSSNPDFQGVVNCVETYADSIAQNTIWGNQYTIVPWPYIHYVLKMIADENGLSLNGSYWNDEELSSLLMYNNYALDKQHAKQDVYVELDRTMVYTPTGILTSSYLIPFRNDTAHAEDDSGLWDNSAHEYDVLSTGDYWLLATINYSVSIRCMVRIVIYNGSTVIATNDPPGGGIGVMSMVGAHTQTVGFLFQGAPPSQNWSVKIFTTALILGHVPTLTLMDTCSFKVEKYDGAIINFHDSKCTVKNHVWDMTVNEFLAKLKNFAKINIDIDWEQRVMWLDLIDRVISGPGMDMTNKADPHPIQLFDEKGYGYKLSYDFGTQDALLVDNFKDYNKNRYLGEYNTTNELPDAATIQEGYIALVLNTNKLMKVNASHVWEVFSDFYYTKIVGNKGNKGKVYKMEIAPMMMTDTAVNVAAGMSDPDLIRALMPTIREGGTSKLFDIENAPSYRVAFMRGEIITTTTGGPNKYVLASSGNLDLNGNEVGKYAMRLEGSVNWHDEFCEKILLAISNSPEWEYLIYMPTKYLNYKGTMVINFVKYLTINVTTQLGKTVKQSVVRLLKT